MIKNIFNHKKSSKITWFLCTLLPFLGLFSGVYANSSREPRMTGLDGNYPAFAAFYKKYSLPETLAAQVSKGDLTGFVDKGPEIDRIINAERMRICIAKHKLDKLDVARKYLANIDGRWTVLAEKVNSSTTDFTPEHFKQLAKIAEETGFRDWGLCSCDNIMVDAQTKKLVFIDTENNSFLLGRHRFEDLSPHNKAQFFVALAIFNDWKMMNKEMADYFNERVNKLREEESQPCNTIVGNRTLDPQGIDFEQVKKEYSQLVV